MTFHSAEAKNLGKSWEASAPCNEPLSGFPSGKDASLGLASPAWTH